MGRCCLTGTELPFEALETDGGGGGGGGSDATL